MEKITIQNHIIFLEKKVKKLNEQNKKLTHENLKLKTYIRNPF